MEWISVKDRLPEIQPTNMDIVGLSSDDLWVTDGKSCGIATFRDGYFRAMVLAFLVPNSHRNLILNNITHWMYLPKPPKEE